jgi:hypothetical protein
VKLEVMTFGTAVAIRLQHLTLRDTGKITINFIVMGMCQQ